MIVLLVRLAISKLEVHAPCAIGVARSVRVQVLMNVRIALRVSFSLPQTNVLHVLLVNISITQAHALHVQVRVLHVKITIFNVLCVRKQVVLFVTLVFYTPLVLKIVFYAILSSIHAFNVTLPSTA